MQFSVENVREVARVLVESNLGEVTLERLASEGARAARLSVKRAAPAPFVFESVVETYEEEEVSVVSSAEAKASKSVLVTATCVGIFRVGKKPVEVGSRVSKRQLVGVVESLRVPNEIYAPEAGVVAQLLVSAGQGVEWGQPLMEIVPATESDATGGMM